MVQRFTGVRRTVRRRWLLIPAGVLAMVALALAGWLWVDRGVGVGLRGQAREVLARYDDRVAGKAGAPVPPPPEDRFPTGARAESAAADDGGSTRLTIYFTGSAPGNGPCERDYYGEALESEGAVAVVLEGKPRDLFERFNLSVDTELCDLIGYRRTVTVTLSEPLRRRAVLDGRSGQPIPVKLGE